MFNVYLLVITEEVLYLKACNLGTSLSLSLAPWILFPLFYTAAAAFAASKTFIILSLSLSGAPQKPIIKSSELNLSGLALWHPVKSFWHTES